MEKRRKGPPVIFILQNIFVLTCILLLCFKMGVSHCVVQAGLKIGSLSRPHKWPEVQVHATVSPFYFWLTYNKYINLLGTMQCFSICIYFVLIKTINISIILNICCLFMMRIFEILSFSYLERQNELLLVIVTGLCHRTFRIFSSRLIVTQHL